MFSEKILPQIKNPARQGKISDYYLKPNICIPRTNFPSMNEVNVQHHHHTQAPSCEAVQDMPQAQAGQAGWSTPMDRAGLLQGVGDGCTGAGIIGREMASENDNVILAEIGTCKKMITLDGKLGGGEIFFKPKANF